MNASAPLCRFCAAPLRVTFADLGMSPLANRYLEPDDRAKMEPFYPLHAYACERCFLVQLEAFETPQAIFTDYAYFSSYSTSWLEHAERFAQSAIERFGLNAKSRVVEIASNDGYLLQYFAGRGIPVLGIEPARNVAAVAVERGIPSLTEFFGVALAERIGAEGPADLLIGNNVTAHVPDINDFIGGFARALKPSGRVSLEFPHLMRLIDEHQFDTIYHEHFSYLSLTTVARIFEKHGMRVVDVEELSTHGGSLRVTGMRADHAEAPGPSVAALLERERAAGLLEMKTYEAFGAAVNETKRALLTFLIEQRRAGKTIVAYGAPAKGNTLLNYCGIREDFIEYTVDRSPHKQGRFLPGTHIPIYPVERIYETKPDFVLILPWNLRQEIAGQMAGVRDWGGRFVVPIPEVAIYP